MPQYCSGDIKVPLMPLMFAHTSKCQKNSASQGSVNRYGSPQLVIIVISVLKKIAPILKTRAKETLVVVGPLTYIS